MLPEITARTGSHDHNSLQRRMTTKVMHSLSLDWGWALLAGISGGGANGWTSSSACPREHLSRSLPVHAEDSLCLDQLSYVLILNHFQVWRHLSSDWSGQVTCSTLRGGAHPKLHQWERGIIMFLYRVQLPEDWGKACQNSKQVYTKDGCCCCCC